MTEVEDWLKDIGLEQYAALFAENAIDGDVLAELTEDHLKELGLPLGHRVKMLRAIKQLGAPAEDAAGTTPAETPPPEAPPARPEAERRQLTIVFCDLVGSTALSARLDPEDMRAVIAAYQSTCSDVIRRYDGHVGKFMGDGVLAYFGYPRAHEDDAERAVRAGLELTDAVGRMAADGGQALAARIGIATGQVVVGDLIGEGAAQEEAVVGDTPNLAARLQGLARPGSVVIAEATRHLIAGLFELADLGNQQLRGFGGAVRAWQVQGDSRAESRFAARSAKGLTPFVGRQHELGMLLDRFEQAREGEGQIVLLSGEPGIGKSRLAHGLLEHLADGSHTCLRFYCSPYHISSALHPMIEHIERAAGFLADDPPERKLDKLEALLGEGTDDPTGAAPLFAALLSIPQGTRYSPLNLPARRQRELTITAIVEQAGVLAGRRPLLMILEDAHWIDPTTSELFERMIERCQTLPALLLITFRPEFAPPWTSYPHMTSLTLNRLGRRHSAEMIAAVAGGKPLPEEVFAQIWAKTEGVPLFVEELTKTVLESGLLEDRGDRYALSGPLPPLAIPATLHDSLMARLDRLAPVKEVAQIGAVIGREFSYRLLLALSPLDEAGLQDALSHLVGAELVFRRGTIPDATYSFKHAFVQDTAYESLLKSRRQQLHARIAKTLLEQFPETAATQPEIVAHHFAHAGLFDEAVLYLERAGELAKSRSAMTEAAAHFSAAIELLSSLADGTERKQRELGLRTAQGAALIAAKGLAAPEVAEVYARAHELCGEVGDEQLLFAALCGQYWYHSQKGELDRALATAEEVLRLAERQEDAAALVIGHRITGTSLFHLGRLVAGRRHLEEAVALYDPDRHASLAALYTFDPLMAGLAFLSWLLLAQGYPDQARKRSLEAIEHARRLDHPHSVAHALSNACLLHQLCRDRSAVERHAADLIALATEQEFRFWLAIGTIMQGWALAEARQAESGIDKIRSGLEDYRATGAALWSPCFVAMLAEAHGRLDQAATGLSILEEALETAQQTGARWYEPELHCLRGRLLLLPPGHDVDEVEACFAKAIAVAREHDARMWELRAATSLARSWCDRGRAAEARDLLGPIVGWFNEGQDLPDLQRARALQGRLGLGADTPASNA